MVLRRSNNRSGPGLVGTMARTAVIAGTATATVNTVNARSGQKAQAHQAAAQAQAQPVMMVAAEPAAPAPDATAPGGITPEMIERLTQLGQLRDSGVLSEAQFEEAKTRVLAG